MFVLILLLVLLILFGILEFRSHQHRVYSIPIRVHVNGTRGKSSVTRLIAAGLRAGGIRTMAKTTGTLPRLIDEKGLEVEIVRPNRANILEHVKVFRYFARRRPQAVVVECMAVQPEYQWICENKFVHSTLGVITNTRLDHVLEMGPTIENITRSLCNTLPPGGVAYTSEHQMFWLMQRQAHKIGCELHRVTPSTVSLDELKGFAHIEHAENVAVALAACEKLGVPRQVALDGMHRSHADVGALRVFEVEQDGKTLQFIYAMAANDPESTMGIWRKATSVVENKGVMIILLHTRADRYDRSLQLLEMIQEGMADQYQHVFLTGEKTSNILATLGRYGIDRLKALDLGHATPERISHEAFQRINSVGTIFGIGNVGSGGLEIVKYFRDRRKMSGAVLAPPEQGSAEGSAS